MRKKIKEYKKFKIGGYFGVFICILLLFFSAYFTSDFVANNLSPDGVLTQYTIFQINFIRAGIGIFSAIGLLFSVLCIFKPNILIEFYSNQNQVWKKLFKLIIFLFPTAFVICAVLVKNYRLNWYKVLFLREDSIIEWLTFIFYFIAFIVSCSISITFYRSNSALFCFMYMFLSIGLFFIAMEEINWGQRIFNVSTPQLLLNSNYQKELNIHNIKWFPLHKLYIIVGFYGAFSRLLVPHKIKIRYRSIVNLFVPDYYLFLYFFVVGSIYLYIEYVSSIAVTLFGDWAGCGPGHFIIEKDQEPAELLLSCGFLLFVIINKYRQVSNKDFARRYISTTYQ
jgi:hypothetical protein